MVINKMGDHHLLYGENNQDFAFQNDLIKCVCDGCGSGKHSEVGAKLFIYLYSRACQEKGNLNPMTTEDIDTIFHKLIDIFDGSPEALFNFMCFTILTVQEDEENFYVDYCGDGYIILENIDGSFEFVKIDNGEYPHYYVYKHMKPEDVKGIQVDFTRRAFSKDLYLNVGVASDGLRFAIDEEEAVGDTFFFDLRKKEFLELLSKGSAVRINRWFNKNKAFLKDDLSVVI